MSERRAKSLKLSLFRRHLDIHAVLMIVSRMKIRRKHNNVATHFSFNHNL